ncbi:MAG TPA: SRPBCC family protein [Alphaproteobacteria bacterium]|nr:SRPBCC family protein [Alphaproteobacteria bacterium]
MTQITINATINAPIDKVWDAYNNPEEVKQWNAASDDWHTPVAQNDLRKGGRFTYRMEAKDGSFGFDFSGVYNDVKNHELIAYTMDDNRKVIIKFEHAHKHTLMTISFDAETQNSIEMQKDGWQSILNNFKKYVESRD